MLTSSVFSLINSAKVMAGKKTKRKAPKRKSAKSKRRKPVGRACRNANMVITRRKRDYKKALAKVKSLKKAVRLAEKSTTKKKNEVLMAQKRAKMICSGK